MTVEIDRTRRRADTELVRLYARAAAPRLWCWTRSSNCDVQMPSLSIIANPFFCFMSVLGSVRQCLSSSNKRKRIADCRSRLPRDKILCSSYLLAAWLCWTAQSGGQADLDPPLLFVFAQHRQPTTHSCPSASSCCCAVSEELRCTDGQCFRCPFSGVRKALSLLDRPAAMCCRSWQKQA